VSDQQVVSLANRARFKPDLGQLARDRVASARRALDASPDEFAGLLAPLLNWNITAEMIECWETEIVPPGDIIIAAGLMTQDIPTGRTVESDTLDSLVRDRYSDLAAVFSTRTDFTDMFSPRILFDGAGAIDAVGLSLNLLCQQYPDTRLRALLDRGAVVRFLFIDPSGDAVRRYEADEGYQPGQIAALTELNIQSIVQRVRDRLRSDKASNLSIRVYDETTRFNLILIDRRRCVMQPYLPGTRGVDSPTFLINRASDTRGLFPTFEQVFASLWERGVPR